MKTTIQTIMKDMLLVVATAMITLGASAQTVQKAPQKKDAMRMERRFEGRRAPFGRVDKGQFHKADFRKGECPKQMKGHRFPGKHPRAFKGAPQGPRFQQDARR